MKKPSINTRCVANHYAAPNERIIEFSNANGGGGLISFRTAEDGSIVVEVYRQENTVVHVSKAVSA